VLDLLRSWIPYLLAVASFAGAAVAAGHALLYKREVPAAIGWVGFILVAPIVGPIAYVVFGVNRIRRRAAALGHPAATATDDRASAVQIAERWGPSSWGRAGLVRFVDSLVPRPLVAGNRIVPLAESAAFSRMLEAIEGAQRSITLATYIFDYDTVGRRFVAALGEAHDRGVAVRVLIDAVGDRYTFPPVLRELRRRRLPSAHFLPTRWPWHMAYVNLRNHRKILVVDGELGFTGGMNIREGHETEKEPRYPIEDLHFAVEGPVVRQLQEVFAEDWLFATRERLADGIWFPTLGWRGSVDARGIADGPDHDLDRVRWTIHGALACATRRVVVVTPYFLPISGLANALEIAARRGVEIDIVLPEKNNLLLVHWASRAMWWEVLQGGCRLWLSPPPFDHTKLMLVDDYWSLIGTANWDPRSLRLNFELDLECHGEELASELDRLARAKLARARPVTLEDVNARSLPLKLWDGAARLLAPYL
jgi:cardiolipin synthase